MPDQAMTIRNPFRPDGAFETADMLHALEAELERMRPALQRLVDAKRMKPENFAAKVGAYEALRELLRERLVGHLPAEIQDRRPVIIYLADEKARQEFLKWAETQGIPTRPA